MTTLGQYSLLNVLALQLAANPAAAVTPDEVVGSMLEGRLLPLLRDTAVRVGADPSLIASLVTVEDDMSDTFSSWANAADLTREYSGDLNGDSSQGWLVLAFAINQVVRTHGGDVDASFGHS